MNEEMAALERDLAVDPSDWTKIERLYAIHERLGIQYKGRSIKQLVKALKGKNPVKTRAYLRSAGIVALPELVKALSDPQPRLVVHAIEHIGELKERGVGAVRALEGLLPASELIIHDALLATAILIGADAWALKEKCIQREVALLEAAVENEISFDFDHYIFEGFTGDPMDMEASYRYRAQQAQGKKTLETLLKLSNPPCPLLKASLPRFLVLRKKMEMWDSPIRKQLIVLIETLQSQ